MKKIRYIIIFAIVIILQMSNKSIATGRVYLATNKDNIKKGEEVEISINIENMSVAALETRVYFDSNKLEFISGPENINVVDNKIFYMWYDENGGKTPKNSGDIAKFKFKAKQEGTTEIYLYGEFYDENGNQNNIKLQGTSVKIEEEAEEEKQIKDEETKENNSNNANLKILRLNHEGIIPTFDENVKEYYMVIDNSIANLGVTAVAQNAEAIVNVTGNTNLKEGINAINIEVVSKDKTQKNNYKIYVTKTKNMEDANANLENLAIENTILYPSFEYNIINYNVEVSNKTENLNILAIPQNSGAIVNIEGKDSFNIGNNIVTITVTAPNGITIKKYMLHVKRRNTDEEKKTEEENKKEAERLSYILNQNNKNNENNEPKNDTKNETKNSGKILYEGIILIVLIILVLVIVIIYKNFYKKNKKK